MLLRPGDIETNPGPEKYAFLKFRHWNLNCLAAHNFITIPSLEAFITIRNYDTVFLSETFLDSTIAHDDTNLNINGYSMLRSDYPSNSKHGEICMYFKESLPLIRRNDLSNIQECLATEITVNNKK